MWRTDRQPDMRPSRRTTRERLRTEAVSCVCGCDLTEYEVVEGDQVRDDSRQPEQEEDDGGRDPFLPFQEHQRQDQ